MRTVLVQNCLVFEIMIYLKLLIYILVYFERAYGQDIEYYPSKAMFHNKGDVQKREINVNQFIDDTGYSLRKNNINFRHFNDENKNKPSKNFKKKQKRASDPVFRGHPKTREELWNEHFINQSNSFDQTPSLIKLIHNLTLTYLDDCSIVILYDSQVKSKESYLFQNLLKEFPVTYSHGYINDDDKLAEPKLLRPVRDCIHFIVFLTDVKRSAKVLGKQSDSKVILVARSSQWAVQEFLASSLSRVFVNLLVIAQSFKEDEDANLVCCVFIGTGKHSTRILFCYLFDLSGNLSLLAKNYVSF